MDCKSRSPISDMVNLSLQTETHRSALCLFDYKHNKTSLHVHTSFHIVSYYCVLCVIQSSSYTSVHELL